MKVNCECGCGGFIEYAPGDSLYLPGHHPNPIKEIKTETISLKSALENKGIRLNKKPEIQKMLTRADKKYIGCLAGHRCFLCGKFQTGHKKSFSVCEMNAHGNCIAVLLCDKCKTNKNKLFNPIINKFNVLETANICEIKSILVYIMEGREESDINL